MQFNITLGITNYTIGGDQFVGTHLVVDADDVPATQIQLRCISANDPALATAVLCAQASHGIATLLRNLGHAASDTVQADAALEAITAAQGAANA